MKKLITLLLPLLMSVACSQPKEPIDLKELNEQEMMYFTKDTNEPYNGDFYSIEMGRTIRRKQEGKLVNGQKMREEFKEGE
tara:strand:+ start:329 stop:571 length:243 start_codon:yes stop_codon:yes gene_type:complete